jgi:uncharacterized membrane protein
MSTLAAGRSRSYGGGGLAVARVVRIIAGIVAAIIVLGILLVVLSDDQWKFSDPWISLSFLLYIVLVVLMVAVQAPNVRKLIAARQAAGGEMTAEAQALARTSAMVGGVINVLWVVVLILMVFKPGA